MNETTGLVAFNELPAISSNANAVYAANKKKLDQGLTKGQTLLDTIEGGGMTDELDAEVNRYLGIVSTAVDQMNTARTPFTQLVSALCKEFTGMENQFDKSKPDTIPGRLQEARNNYAREKERAARAKEEELRRQRVVEEEKINIKARIQAIVRDKYNDILYNFKKKYNDIFNTLNLDNYDDVKKQLIAMKIEYPRDKFLEIAVPVTSNYLDTSALAPLIYDGRLELFTELSEHFRTEMSGLKQYLFEQLPARKFELEEIEKAGVAEKKRLKEAAELRQREEDLRIEKERQENERKAAEAIDLQKSVNQAELSFTHDAAHAELRTDQAAVKHYYLIKVMSAIGYQQIAALWFKEFGLKTPLEKLEKKTLGQMRADLEKLAFNGGERLADSDYLIYESDVKAVTKKNV